MSRENSSSISPEMQEHLKQKPPHERRTIERVWHLLDTGQTSTATNMPDTDAAWEELQRRLDATAKSNKAPRRAPDRKQMRRTRRNRWLTGAAVSLAVVLVGLWGWRQPIRVVAPPGVHRAITLPDGSTVELNSDSQLRYARAFQAWPFVSDARRTVTLQGEAFFDVVRGERPFVVETFNAHAEVLGTTFNVRARQDPLARATRVTLASGTVRVVAQKNPDVPVLLSEPGQTARIADAAPTRSPSTEDDLDRVLAWREQGFTVVDEPLAAILKEIERRYALSIETTDGLALTDSMTLFYLHGTTAEQILHDICLAQGCTYRPTSRGFALDPAPPPTQ